MQKYNFNRIKGWTEEQIKNGEYHEFNRTRIYTDTRNKKRRVKSLGGMGGVAYTHWVWNECYGHWPSNGMQVHHIDGNTLNDNIENLAVMSKSEHIRHCGGIDSVAVSSSFYLRKDKIINRKQRQNCATGIKVGASIINCS